MTAWLEWRRAAHAATNQDGRDPLLTMLRDWWLAKQLPPLPAVSEAEAGQVLAQIAQLEWNTRPY